MGMELNEEAGAMTAAKRQTDTPTQPARSTPLVIEWKWMK
jgi:hypothetical protein